MPIEFECPSCRKRIAADAALGTRARCPHCSSVVEVPSPAAGEGGVPPIEPVSIGMQPARQGLAIGALVCGILGLVTCVVPIGVAGFVLGIIALVRINKRPADYRGRGMAVGGICTGGLSILLILVALAFLPWARERSRRTDCARNMQRIGSALYTYTRNYEGGFPPNLNTPRD